MSKANQPSDPVEEPRVPASLWLSCLAAIVGAELAVAAGRPLPALIIYGALLAVLPICGSVARPSDRGLLVALMLIPIFRIGAFCTEANVKLQLPVYLLLLAEVFITARLLNLSLVGRLPPLRGLVLQLVIGAFGLPLGVVIWLVLAPAGLPEDANALLIVASALGLAAMAVAEELAFRGLLQTTALRAIGVPGLVLVSVLFAVLHVSHRSGGYLAIMFGLGLIAAWTVLRTKSTLGVALAHVVASLVAYMLLPGFAPAVESHRALSSLSAGVLAASDPAPAVFAPLVLLFILGLRELAVAFGGRQLLSARLLLAPVPLLLVLFGATVASRLFPARLPFQSASTWYGDSVATLSPFIETRTEAGRLFTKRT